MGVPMDYKYKSEKSISLIRVQNKLSHLHLVVFSYFISSSNCFVMHFKFILICITVKVLFDSREIFEI